MNDTDSDTDIIELRSLVKELINSCQSMRHFMNLPDKDLIDILELDDELVDTYPVTTLIRNGVDKIACLETADVNDNAIERIVKYFKLPALNKTLKGALSWLNEKVDDLRERAPNK